MEFEDRRDWRNEDQGAPVTKLYAEDLLRYEMGLADARDELNALQPLLTKSRLARRHEDPIRIAVFSDSRGEGYTHSSTEGITDWADTFPIRLASELRLALGLPAGGRGWIPLTLTGTAEEYRFSVSAFVAGGNDLVVGDTGVPGSQWMTEAKTIRIPLSPGCTSVDVVSAGAGGGFGPKLTGQSGVVEELGHDGAQAVYFDRLEAPGTYVDITSGGGGYFALGVIEYCGDEDAGVQVLNFSVSGIDSVDMAAHLTKPAMEALLDAFDADISVVALGANDVDHALTTAQSKTSMAAILSRSGGIPLAVTVIPAGPAGPVWTALNAAIRGLDATVVDIVADLPASNASAALGLFLSDGTHLTLSGNVAFADDIRVAVMGR